MTIHVTFPFSEFLCLGSFRTLKDGDTGDRSTSSRESEIFYSPNSFYGGETKTDLSLMSAPGVLGDHRW